MADPEIARQHRQQNRWHSLLLLIMLVALLSVIGWLILGLVGLLAAWVFCGITYLSSQNISPGVILRMYRARRIEAHQAPELLRMFGELARRAELAPIPSLYIIPTRLPNAFAVGIGERSAVAITDGLLRMLTARETAGVLAHELAHIQHEDTRLMAFADGVSRLIGAAAQISLVGIFLLFPLLCSGLVGGWTLFRMFVAFLLLLVAPTISNLLQLALSRAREFDADLGSAMLTGDPLGLASALRKLDRLRPTSIWDVLFPGQRMPQPAIIRSHPPTVHRVERLEALRKKADESAEIVFVEPVATRRQPRHRILVPVSAPVREKPRIHRNGIWY